MRLLRRHSDSSCAIVDEEHAHRDQKDHRDHKGSPGGIFPDAKLMKDEMRDKLTSPEYDVTNYYREVGFCQFVARHTAFEKMTLVVIGLNAIWIGVDTDWNHASMLLEADPIFQIAEHLFCMYFLFEWTMRFGAFERKCNGLRDAWFVFDSVLVFTMVVETWAMPAFFVIAGSSSGSNALGNASILRIARLLRLTRMARMARLLRALPELLILIKGMLGAMRSVALTLGLLLLILYVFAIAFTQLCADSDCSEHFDGVLTSMHVLLVNGALMDSLIDIIEPLMEESIVLLMVFYFYLLLAALTIMNMLIGVICEVVSAVASTEREAMTMSYVSEKIHELMNYGDGDDDNEISKDEFMQMLRNDRAMEILADVGIDVVGLVDFVDYIFEADNVDFLGHSTVHEAKEKTLTFGEFMKVILDMRGSNTATVRDIVDLRKFVKERIVDLGRKLDRRLSMAPPEYSRTLSRTLSSVESPVSARNGSLGGVNGSLGGITDSFHGLVNCAVNMLVTAHDQEIAALRAENSRLHELVQNFDTVVTSQIAAPEANPIELEEQPGVATHDLVPEPLTNSLHGELQEVQEAKRELLDGSDSAWLTQGPAQVCDGYRRLESVLMPGDVSHREESSPEQRKLAQLPTATLRDTAATEASAHCRCVLSDSCWGTVHKHDCHPSPELRPTASYIL